MIYFNYKKILNSSSTNAWYYALFIKLGLYCCIHIFDLLLTLNLGEMKRKLKFRHTIYNLDDTFFECKKCVIFKNCKF